MIAKHLSVRTSMALAFTLSATSMTNIAIADSDSATNTIIVQSTTSTDNSGFYTYYLPIAEAATGITAHVVAVGTGQAIKNAKNCDGDVLLVHAQSAEEAFVNEGYGVARHDLMYNDFVLISPEGDPANIGKQQSASDALAKIAASEAIFASRGDDSGTHKKELSLWAQTDIDPTQSSGQWYRETGTNMGATLNTAISMDAYVMSDRATWINFGNKNEHRIAFDGDPALFNQYGIIAVNPKACPDVNIEAAKRWIDFALSPEGQTAINEYTIKGKQAFVANATTTTSTTED